MTGRTARSLGVERPYTPRYFDVELPDTGLVFETRFSGVSAGTEVSWIKGTNPTLDHQVDSALGLFEPGSRA